MNSRTAVPLFIFLLFSVFIFSETSADKLTLDRAVEAALDYDAELSRKRSMIEVTSAQALAYKDRDDPQLRVQADDEGDIEVALRYFLIHPWMKDARREQGQAALRAEKKLFNRRKWEVKSTVYESFASLYFLEEDLNRQQELIELYKQHKDHIEEKKDEYLATKAQLLTIEAQLLEQKWEHSRDMKQLQRLKDELRKFTGLYQWKEGIIFPGWLTDFQPFEWQEESMIQELYEKHPQLDYLKWQEKELNFLRQEYEKESIPWPEYIQASASSDSSVFPDDSWAVQLGINIPLFSRRHAKHAVVSERIDSKQKSRQYYQRDLANELRSQLDEVTRWQDELKTFQSTWDGYYERIENYLKDPVTRDKLDVVEDIEMQKRLLQTERSALSLQRNIIEAVLTVRQTAASPILLP